MGARSLLGELDEGRVADRLVPGQCDRGQVQACAGIAELVDLPGLHASRLVALRLPRECEQCPEQVGTVGQPGELDPARRLRFDGRLPVELEKELNPAIDLHEAAALEICE